MSLAITLCIVFQSQEAACPAKIFSVKTRCHYLFSYFSYMTFIESDYFPWVKQFTKSLYQKYIFKCVTCLYEFIYHFKIEL